MQKYALDNADITITGQSAGRDVEITTKGNIEIISEELEYELEYVLRDDMVYVPRWDRVKSQQPAYNLTAKLKPIDDTGAVLRYTIKENMNIYRTAHVHVDTVTVEQVAAALKAAGAPKGTPFRVQHGIDTGEMDTIVFEWSEK